MKWKILIVDDDAAIAGLTKEYLEAKGCEVTFASNGVKGLKLFQSGKFDLCILDVRMPMMSGFELAEEIRAIDKDVPFIFLTGESQQDQRIKGLMLGADDYLTKPFSLKELYLRIEVVFRRMGRSDKVVSEHHTVGKYKLDTASRTLRSPTGDARLSEIESLLLEALCKAKDGSVSRDYLLQSIWQDEAHLKSRSLNVYISKLRKRLSQDPNIEILNIHGAGYRMIVHS